MKKILLTGGSGFIGKNLLESPLVDKYEIIAPRHSELDVADTDNVDRFFSRNQFDVVLHSAVKPGHRNAKDFNNLFITNIRMFENLERNKSSFGKLINFGSGAVYDVAKNNSGVSEKEMFKNMGSDDHSFCKYVVAKQIENIDNFTDLNIFGIFGKYEDYAIRFISNAICKSLVDLPITLRQNRRFSYLDVNDLPQIVEFFIENNPHYKSYNVCPDNYLELLDLAKLVREISGKNIPIKVAAQGYGLDYYGDNSRLKAEIPDLKFTAIKTSVENLYSYYSGIKDKINIECLLMDK